MCIHDIFRISSHGRELILRNESDTLFKTCWIFQFTYNLVGRETSVFSIFIMSTENSACYESGDEICGIMPYTYAEMIKKNEKVS